MSLFELGRVLTTNNIKKMMDSDVLFRVGVQQALADHINGDWGDLSDDDRKMNDEAFKEDRQVLLSYNIETERIFISRSGIDV